VAHDVALAPDELADLTAAFRAAAKDALASPADLATFCDPSYRRPPHVDLISIELARLVTGEVDRLMIRQPPQTGKTRTAAVWTPFWWLAQHPDHRVLIGSYSNTLAVARGRQIRKLVDHHGWRYGLEREYGEGTVADWALSAGGGVKSAGVGGGLTGSPGDLGVIDDPHKGRQEAESRLIRERVWDWYSGDFLSRLAPGAPLILIMTPWHEDDLSHRVLDQDGRIEEGGGWRVVDLPAFAVADDPLGREPGAPLTHPKIPSEDVEALRAFWEGRRERSTARDWTSLYMLAPKPLTEALVTKDMCRQRTHIPVPAKPRRAVVGVDPSGGGRDNAGIVAGFLADDRRAYITEDRSLHAGSEVWGRVVAELAADIDADLIVVEPNYGRDMAVTIVKAAWATLRRENPQDRRYQRPAPAVKLAPWAKKNKQLRADPAAQQINDDQVRFGAPLPELKSQLTSWRPTDTESPGNLDACVYLIYELLPMDNEPSTVEAPPATPLPGTSSPAAWGMVPGLGLPGGVQVNPALDDMRRGRRR
jgi:hypothetical protein